MHPHQPVAFWCTGWFGKAAGRGAGIILQIADIDQFGMVVRHAVGEDGGLNGIQFEEALENEQVVAVRHYAESFQEEPYRTLRREVREWVSGIS